MAFTTQDGKTFENRSNGPAMSAGTLSSDTADVYPESNPTAGDACRAEAKRLNDQL